MRVSLIELNHQKRFYLDESGLKESISRFSDLDHPGPCAGLDKVRILVGVDESVFWENIYKQNIGDIDGKIAILVIKDHYMKVVLMDHTWEEAAENLGLELEQLEEGNNNWINGLQYTDFMDTGVWDFTRSVQTKIDVQAEQMIRGKIHRYYDFLFMCLVATLASGMTMTLTMFSRLLLAESLDSFHVSVYLVEFCMIFVVFYLLRVFDDLRDGLSGVSNADKSKDIFNISIDLKTLVLIILAGVPISIAYFDDSSEVVVLIGCASLMVSAWLAYILKRPFRLYGKFGYCVWCKDVTAKSREA